MKKILLLAILSLSIETASSQWMQSLVDVGVNNMNIAHYFGESNLYFYGDINNQLLLSEDNGKSFININHPLGSSRFRITTYNDSTNILTPQGSFVLEPAFFYISTNKGTSWDKKYFYDSNGDTLTSISTILFTHIWENGKGLLITREKNNFTKNFVYLSQNFGTTWDTSFECNFSYQNSFIDPSIMEDRLVFRSALFEQKIFVLGDYGKTTEEIILNSNDPSRSLNSMAFKDSLNGLFLIGGDIYKTLDGGKTLVYTDHPDVNIARLSYAIPSSDSSVGFYYGSSISSGGFYSIDDSDSWVMSETKGISYQIFKNSEIGIASIRNSTSEPFLPHYFKGNLLSVNSISRSNNFIKTYPNPSDGSFTIELEESAKIQIYTTTGTLVFSGILEPGVQNISLPSLTSGLYILKAYSANFQQFSRIVVE